MKGEIRQRESLTCILDPALVLGNLWMFDRVVMQVLYRSPSSIMRQYRRRHSVRLRKLSTVCFCVSSSLVPEENHSGGKRGGARAFSPVNFVSDPVTLLPQSRRRLHRTGHRRKNGDSSRLLALMDEERSPRSVQSLSSTSTETKILPQTFKSLSSDYKGNRAAEVVGSPDVPRRVSMTRNTAPPPPLHAALLVIASAVVAAGIISWEGLVAEHALPSRQTRFRVVSLSSPSSPSSSQSSAGKNPLYGRNNGWGQVTVRGMGFGWEERQLLMQQQDHEPSNKYVSERTYTASTETVIGEANNPLLQLPDRPSYNEIMKKHRQETVRVWKQLDDRGSIVPDEDGHVPPMDEADTGLHLQEDQAAIRSVLSAVESIESLQRLAASYRWDALREALHSNLWQAELNAAAARLRTIEDVSTVHEEVATASRRQELDSISSTIGFDWGSCAWRRNGCGVWADWQESIDQIDSLLGVLEPHEVLFCLDIVERSLREVLDIIPPSRWHPRDLAEYQALRPYRSYFASLGEEDSHGDYSRSGVRVESDNYKELDPYLRVLMDLRVD